MELGALFLPALPPPWRTWGQWDWGSLEPGGFSHSCWELFSAGNWGSTGPNDPFSLGEAFVVGSKKIRREQERKLRTPQKTRKLRFLLSFQNPEISAWMEVII